MEGNLKTILEVFILKSYNSVKKIQTRGIISIYKLKSKMANLLQVFLLKEKSFPISIVRMLYKYLNLPSSIFSSATGVEILCIAKVNNANSCYSSVKLLIFRMSKEETFKKIWIRSIYKGSYWWLPCMPTFKWRFLTVVLWQHLK